MKNTASLVLLVEDKSRGRRGKLDHGTQAAIVENSSNYYYYF